jgi:CheY-like chemotaxis protein
MNEKKILIVEDNALVARETKERLAHLGYMVTGIAATGKNAVDLARTTRPDLILMDINLKGEMDGITAAEQIAVFLDAPVLYLTAYSDDETLKRAMKTKPVAYLIKPFKERELYSNIEMALYKRKAEKKISNTGELDELVSAFTELPEGVIVTDTDERIVFMNRSASVLLGYSAEEAVGNLLASIFVLSRGDRSPGADPDTPSFEFPALPEERLDAIVKTRGGKEVSVTMETMVLKTGKNPPEGHALVFWADDKKI